MSRLKPTHAMVNGSTEYTFTGWMSEFPEENLPMLGSAINKLGKERKPGDVNTMVRVYPLPEGAKQGEEVHPKEWVQTAGTAERLTVEVKRREADGAYRQYVVGRPSAAGEPSASEPIRFGEHEVSVRPSEVLSAADAVGLFQHYYEHASIPEGWNLRELPEYADTSEQHASSASASNGSHAYGAVAGQSGSAVQAGHADTKGQGQQTRGV
jgi:hypothetical protein